MAAPILSKKQQAACLSKKASIKSKKKKNQLKNVLFGGNVSRPKASQQVEDVILLKLSDILKGLPNIFKPVRSDSKKELEAKRKVRVQLDLGTNCVCRSLEKDRLACVLVSGKVTPAPALDQVIALAQETGCPLLCLDAFNVTLAKVTKSKCLPVCIGFKRPNPSGGLADFVDVISLVQQNTTVSKRALKALKGKKFACRERPSLPESIRPVCLDASTDEAVREQLKKTFANAAINKVESRMMTPKEKKRKKNKKKQTKTYYRQWFHKQFESGKNTVTQHVGEGRMQVVLVITQLVPVLMTEPPGSSLLRLARDQDCPVLVISNLSMVMSPDPANKLAILGIKKESSLGPDTKSAFRPVIDICLDFMRSAPMPTQDMDVEDDDDDDEDVENAGFFPINKKLKPEADEGEEEQDYSFMYVMKKDSDELKEKALKWKQEEDNASKQMTFGGDFISFGGSSMGTTASTESGSLLGKRKSEKPLGSALMKPKKMNLDTKSSESFIMLDTSSEKDAVMEQGSSYFSSSILGDNNNTIGDNKIDNTSSVFSVSRGGDQKNKPNPTKRVEVLGGVSGVAVQSTPSSSSLLSSSVLGMEPLEATAHTVQKEGEEHVSNVFSATTTMPKGEKQKRHGQEGFLSFAYTEANIHTMVANPERRKKKKEKK